MKLDKYNADTKIEELGLDGKEKEFAERYIEGVKRIQDAVKGKYAWDEVYHEATVIKKLGNAAPLKKKLDNAAAELGFDVWRMFEDAEKSPEQLLREAKDLQNYQEIMKQNKFANMIPKKITEEDIRAKRAVIFDKLVSERGSAPKTAAAEAKTPETKIMTSVNELSDLQRVSDCGIKFGAAREKAPVKKELDLGFTEISKDDIVKANQNVKKPIIGEPRKK